MRLIKDLQRFRNETNQFEVFKIKWVMTDIKEKIYDLFIGWFRI